MDKILTFIVNEYNEILLLKGSENDPQFKKSLWYVVTGGCIKYAFEELGLRRLENGYFKDQRIEGNTLKFIKEDCRGKQ